MLLSAEQLSINFGSRQLLQDVDFYLNEGDKTGVIGINGTGKSTFLKVLAGLVQPDSGRISRRPNLQVSYLPQNPEMDDDRTILEQVFLSFPPEFRELNEYEAKSMLTKLGLTEFERKVGTLSGGQRKRLALAAAVPVVPLPGANAALTGLIASGMDTTRFTFVGFLPKTKKHRTPVLEGLKETAGTLIFYEAPHRIAAVLAEMAAVFGDRSAVLCRELTKKYEEYLRGTLFSLHAALAAAGSRGEFVLLVAGAAPATAEVDADYPALVRELMDGGADKKEAIRIVAKRCGVSRREVYQAVLTL